MVSVSSRDDLGDLLLDAFRSVCTPHQCCYVAGPIEHCRDIYLSASLSAEARQAIVLANRRSLKDFATELRAKLPHPVIDPGLLVVPGWDGSRHGHLFLGVLEEFCKEVRFADGWEYSLGATKEAVRAYELGLACYDQAGSELPVSRAISLVEAAVESIRASDVDEPRFERRLQDLRRVSGLR